MNTPKGDSEEGNGLTLASNNGKARVITTVQTGHEPSASPGRDVHTSYPTTINYNGWMDADNYQLQYQLMFEAERELLKEDKTENKLTFYTMFDEVVAGVQEGYKVKLSLHMETPPALSVTTEDGDFVGMFYLRDPEFQSSPTTVNASEVTESNTKNTKSVDKRFCSDCMRWINGGCTEITLDTFKVYPNCFLKKSHISIPKVGKEK